MKKRTFAPALALISLVLSLAVCSANVPEMLDLTSVRLDDPKGVRFAALIDLATANDENTEEYGFLTTTKSRLDNKGLTNDDLTFDADIRTASAANYVKGGAHIVYDTTGESIPAVQSGVNQAITAVLTGIEEPFYKEAFVIRPYIKIGGDTFYGTPRQNSLYDAALALKNNTASYDALSITQKAALHTILGISDGEITQDGVLVMDGVTSLRAVDSGEGAQTTVFTGADLDKYLAYTAKYDSHADFSKYAEHTIGDNHFATYTDSDSIYTLAFTPFDHTVRVIKDRKTNTVLPPLEGSVGTKVCEPSLTQLGLEYNYDKPDTPYDFSEPTSSNFQIGMCYIYRLEDGSFIVIDGGFKKAGNAEKIYNKLRELSADYLSEEDPVTISAWIITHMHADHIGAFRQYVSTYMGDTDLQYLIYNTGAEAQYLNFLTEDANLNPRNNFLKSVDKYVPDSTKILFARPGQTIAFAGATIEVLLTDECLPESVYSGNSLSVQFRIHTSGHSFLFPADSAPDTTDLMCDIYGDALASDFVQVVHHGSIGGSNEFYALVDPTVVLWPLGEWYYYPDPANPDKKTRSTETYHTFLFESENVREIILAGHTDRTLPLPYTYPTDKVIPNDSPF